MHSSRVLLLIASWLAATPAPQSSPTDAIAKVRSEWAQDLHDKQLEKIAMLYAPDAMFLQPNGARISGRQAIRELNKSVMAMFTSTITLRSAVVEISGNLAYDSGAFEERLIRASDGKVIDTKGSYLMVFKRQANGAWLITQQAWTGTEPAQ